MTELKASTSHSDRHADHSAATKPDASRSLREQYFDCVAAGQTQCTYSSPERQNQRPSDTPANQPTSGRTLEFTNPYTSDRPPTQPTPIDSSKVLPRSNWTVAINLTTTLDVSTNPHDENAPDVHDGARTKTAQLLDLAESTKGKSVTLVVQNAERDPNFHPQLPGKGSKDSDQVSEKVAAADGNGMLLHTYILHDGKIDELPARQSAGIAADTQALLATAGKQAPSDHIALISQSHGGGPDGIQGDTGRATLDQVNAAIKNGLQGSGHEKLDVLDFDACEMGNSRVLTAIAGSADQIVASTENEGAGATGADGQNIRATMQALLNKPDMTPAQLAEQTIKVADAGLNDDQQASLHGQRRSGTATLSQYDASKIEQFNHAVGDLGDALNNAWKNEQNHNGIRAAIENTPLSNERSGSLAQNPEVSLRDAKTLATNLMHDIDQKTISDPDGSLKRAAEELLRGRDAMVTNYHGSAQGGYDRQGGVSLFMPGDDFFNNQERAGYNNKIAALPNFTTGKSAHLSSKDFVLSMVDEAIADGKKAAGSQPAGDNAFTPLEQARANLAQAKTEQDFKQALDKVAQESRRFTNSATGSRAMNGTIQEMERNMNRVMREQEDPTNTGWNNFLASLATDAPQVYHN